MKSIYTIGKNTLSCSNIIHLVLILSINPFFSYAQDRLFFDPINLDNGLSQNTIQVIHQDRQGFMWFGTQDGLNRYDGYTIEIFRNQRKNTNSIIDNEIQDIHESKDGLLWIATRSGLSCYNPMLDVFSNYFSNRINRKSHDKFSKLSVFAITEDAKSTLWIGTESGLFYFDKVQKHFRTFESSNGKRIPNEPIRNLITDANGFVWVSFQSNNKTIVRFDGITHTLENLSTAQIGIEGFIATFFMSKEGVLWAATSEGIFYFDTKQNRFFKLIKGNFTGITQDLMGKMWFAEEKQLITYNPKQQQYTFFQLSEYGIENEDIRLFCDNSGIMWLGTATTGALKFDAKQNKFNTYSSQKVLPFHRSTVIWTICQTPDQHLWIGSDAGISVLKPTRNEYVDIQKEYPALQFLENRNINVIKVDKQNTLWIGTNDADFYAFNLKTKILQTFKTAREELDSTKVGFGVLCIDIAKNGDIWVGSFEGLTRIYKHNNQFRVRKYTENDGLPSANINALYIDAHQTLWAGTDQGLAAVQLLPSNKISVKNYYSNPQDFQTLSHNSIRSISPSEKEGVLWIGTPNGLNRLDTQTGKNIQLSEKHILANASIYGILKDKSHNLWISTNVGILKYEVGTDNFMRFDVRDGLQSNEFNSGAYTLTEDGEMFFGGIKGFSSFFPQNIVPNPYKPPVIITDFKLFNNSVAIDTLHKGKSPLKRHISYTDYIELSHNQYIFSFDFVAMNYSLPEKNEYAYMMENFESSWNYVGNRHFANYSNLPPGDYIFRVKACNNDGVWNEEGTSIRIKIRAPFWQQGWFIGLLAIGLLFFMRWLYQFRIDQIQKQKKYLELLVKKRTDEVSHQAEELQKQATMLASQNKLIEEQKNDVERSYKNVQLLTEIGMHITSSLEIDVILEMVYEYVNDLMPASVFGIGIYNEVEERLDFQGTIEKGEKLPFHFESLEDENRFSVLCFKRQEVIFITDYMKEHSLYIPNSLPPTAGEPSVSLIYIPLVLANTKKIGVITVQSFLLQAYTEYHLNILKNIAVYTAIALENGNIYTQMADKTRQITDSIRYARKIQGAILPPISQIKGFFPDSFIFFNPKDWVSGDFYYFSQKNDKYIIAAVDCTGHGVPGGFMSMISYELLNEIIQVNEITRPDMVLMCLHRAIIRTLRQGETESEDGMDITLCTIDLHERLLSCAAAQNPLMLFSKEGELTIFRGNRYSLGGTADEREFEFDCFEHSIRDGDLVYLYSDGFEDQFGGEKNKKYMKKRFREFLINLQTYPIDQQHEIISQEFDTWKGNREQVDDVLVMGLQFNFSNLKTYTQLYEIEADLSKV